MHPCILYYDGYLVAQNDEQVEASIEGQYKDLIQSQIGEQDEEGIAEQELSHLHENGLEKDNGKEPVEQMDSEVNIPAADIIDELGL